MDDSKKDPAVAAVMELTCRFLTSMLDAKLMTAEAASEFLMAVERAALTGKQTPQSIVACAAAIERRRSADIG